MPNPHAHIFLPSGHLVRGHQAAMIIFMASDGRSPPLDGIGQKTYRAFMRNSGEFFCHGRNTITAQIFHQLGQFSITAPIQQGRNIALIG